MIRFGIIGTNWITDRLIDAGTKLDDFQVAAVYSRSKENAKDFAARYGIRETFTNLDEMAKSNKIDAVYIASPNSLHATQAITFMNHRKHVLCEKPLASNTAEVDSMIEAANANQVLLMEAMKTTLLPNFKSIQQNLYKLGKIRRYVGNFSKYSSRYDAYKEGTILNAFKPEFSNGSLMDLGVYCIYPMVLLFGHPNSIKASSYLLETQVDGEGSLLIEYDEMDAVIMHSKISNSYSPSEIIGEDGSMMINNISEPTEVEIRYKDGSTEKISVEDEMPSMYYELREFIDLIKLGKLESEVNSHQHSRTTAEIIEVARKQTGIVYPADK
ncbi:Gfo/Idh/MocA family oxidoreductase [Bacillus luteolus]|uniref:Gfo/Idh/MocA family oxidoreductase n=1 Tax=Litchfieldia luteola TaxID=682179 RepID=A0ABR9QM57_9BACI|nr:Gfo/Idh/MocA family oxidoreductase [Cytobacillus luteolus]MBE4909595.1 Gfo/Idh/MocA family oxidoreductase [Cytobacillus luteolus]MBP1940996.1 putative dehydrogenase [Cytobacillus luteolus]